MEDSRIQQFDKFFIGLGDSGSSVLGFNSNPYQEPGEKKSNFEESAKKKSYNLRLYTIIYAGIHYAVGLFTEDCVGQTCDSL